MKSKIFRVSMPVVLAALVFSGCASIKTDKGVFDTTVPQESLCELQIHDSMSIDQFNETYVKWAPEKLLAGTTLIKIPAGQHNFAGSYIESNTDSTGYTRTQTIKFTVAGTCVAGHTYKIYKKKTWLVFLTLVKIKFKDVTPRKVLAKLNAK
ncbi:MAG: hypothetical protein Ta2G_01750 [Termitinemataceae bacterium]|nr:MAG: hypothetical protein Ta2G_01750 [Termitinemataceae bacterium]